MPRAGGADSPEGRRGEGHGTPDVHGVAEDVEGETLDAVVHENAEIVAEEGAGDAERPGGGDDKDLAKDKERGGEEGVEGRGEELHLGLLRDRTVVSEEIELV